MIIYTYGDSHSAAGFQNLSIPGVTIRPHHVGPKLMHSIGRDGLHLPFTPQPEDWVILSVGEIDCRCHIGRLSTPDNEAEIIRDVADRFEQSIAEARVPCHVAIYGIVPPPRRSTVVENPEYPFVGDDDQRKRYAQSMNRVLSAICDRRNWLFVDVYDKYCDSDAFLSSELSDGSVHVSDPSPLEDFVVNRLLRFSSSPATPK